MEYSTVGCIRTLGSDISLLKHLQVWPDDNKEHVPDDNRLEVTADRPEACSKQHILLVSAVPLPFSTDSEA
jgi:hypothetical protein